MVDSNGNNIALKLGAWGTEKYYKSQYVLLLLLTLHLAFNNIAEILPGTLGSISHNDQMQHLMLISGRVSLGGKYPVKL